MNEPPRFHGTITINGQPVTVTFGPSHSHGMMLGPPTRRLPRISLRKGTRYWAARWTAQNGSYLEEEATTRVQALRMVIATARYQRWPLITSKSAA